ncbi:MAG TPA: hypothetical protein VHC90_20195 [Bryobacteraceae bacterium]|nr:hypothetical protein [Bryobacteraceae bacterium]
MKRIVRMLLLSAALTCAAIPQASDEARIERHGDIATLSVLTFRPLDAIAAELEARFGIAVSAEDPFFQFHGDLMEISAEDPRLRLGTLVPARWGFDLTFPINPDGSPRNVRQFLTDVAAEANRHSAFGWRLEETEGVFFLVPARTRNAQGQEVDATPLLDRLVTIPSGNRQIRESAGLLAADLSRQTGLHVSCCEGAIAGIPWGMEQIAFSADREPARSVLLRLGLRHWHVRCDLNFCGIYKW